MQQTTPSQIGDYQIIEQVGVGGMATIYRAHQPKLGRDVAIKLVHRNLIQDRNYLARFEREARIIARLDHPNIVPLYDYDEFEGQPYLVMKIIEGTTLKEVLANGTLTLDEILRIMRHVAEALDYAHANGILHRDMKPSNILIDRNGTPYLTDFGLARIVRQGESTLSADMMLGTPQYVSPEQARGSETIDARTDVYSFGVILYELVVGRVPFMADFAYALIHKQIYNTPPMPSRFNPDVPSIVEQVLLKALEKQPDDRYPTPVALMTAFENAVKQSGLTSLDEDRQSIALQIPSETKPRQSGDYRGEARRDGRFITIPAGERVSRTGSENFWVLLSERIRQGVEDVKQQIGQQDFVKGAAANLRVKAEEFRITTEQARAGAKLDTDSKPRKLVSIGDEYGTDSRSIRRRINQRLQQRRGFFAYTALWLALIFISAISMQPAFHQALDSLSTEPDVLKAFDSAGGDFLTPLRQISLPLVIALLGAGGFLSRGMQVYFDSGSRLESKQRQIEAELEDAYGPYWQEEAGEGAYYRVRQRIERSSRQMQGFLSHLFSAILLTVAISIAWTPIHDALAVFALESSRYSDILALPIPLLFAVVMVMTLVLHGLVLGVGRLLSAEPDERLIAQELQREIQHSGAAQRLTEKKKKHMPEQFEEVGLADILDDQAELDSRNEL